MCHSEAVPAVVVVSWGLEGSIFLNHDKRLWAFVSQFSISVLESLPIFKGIALTGSHTSQLRISPLSK